MISKEKRVAKSLLVIILLILITIVLLIVSQKAEKTTYASSDNVRQEDEQISTNLKISNAKKIDIDEILKKNSTIAGYREEIIVKQEELEYITKYRNNDKIYIGQTAISQEGRGGIQAITIKKTYDENNKLIKEEQVSAVVIKASINKVIDIGTKKKEEPKPKVDTATGSNNLDINMALNKPSGFTLEQFTKALTDSKDKNKIFQDNAKYFYYIEKQYNINGLFVASVGIHESAWGTSKIARNKNNLFGYGAYDSNPYNGAYTFESYSESIDLLARVFVKYYLNPKGTKIYGNETATGQYYNGNTLTAVNKKYATDKNWANGVFKHMQYLYNKI